MSTDAPVAAPDASTPSVEQTLIPLLSGMWAMRAVAAAGRLRIFDALASGPRSAAEVAAQLKTHPGATARLMRALANLGVLTAPSGGRFALTAAGDRLRSDHPATLRDMFIAESDTLHWGSWARLEAAVETGKPQPKEVFGVPAFDYYGAHPDEGRQFGQAMENISRFAAHAVLEAYDFSDARTIMDVGGGNGSMVISILQRHPATATRGLVFDLPYIEPSARESIRAAGLEDRCRFEAGSFFERAPEGADVHVLKFILHDWSDEESVRLLERCRAALAPGGRMVVIETLVPDHNRPEMVHLMDLNMLVMTGGLERTEAEYAALFARAGLRLSRAVPTSGPFSVLEASGV
jgi:SAM-dependent methyltransferase